MPMNSFKLDTLRWSLIHRVESFGLPTESTQAATALINAAVRASDIEMLQLIERYTMMPLDVRSIVSVVTALRAAGRHEDVPDITIEHLLHHSDVMHVLSRYTGSSLDAAERRHLASEVIVSTFDDASLVPAVLSVIRREGLTTCNEIMRRANERPPITGPLPVIA